MKTVVQIHICLTLTYAQGFQQDTPKYDCSELGLQGDCEGKQGTSLPVFKGKELLVDSMWQGKTSCHDPDYGDVDDTFSN